ncbi:hypothetical protein [Endozoicomonas montiporae]|uniref:Uncharacterized protein n=1 Tax=Endozoicomonas montiporae CL-33 TaxID=570277 RepID=A0A142BGA8_9GAMM|nr:hypothetical protein [Endozoicomonas montiporae]AMO57784.1 hypothetical protein EZMO1_3842 [Endozoicomonas montiporae CL-33]
MKEHLSAWLLAVVVTFVVGSIAQSQFVLAGLEQIGVAISYSSRFYTTLNDLVGLLPGYGTVIAIGFLPAFGFAGWIRKKLQTGLWVFPLAGFVTILTIFAAMYPIFEVTLVAGARSTAGLVCQCLSGALGGVVFTTVNRRIKGEV